MHRALGAFGRNKLINPGSLVKALALENSRVISLCGSGGKTSLMTVLVRELALSGECVLATTTTKMGEDEIAGPWLAHQAKDAAGVLQADQTQSILAYRRLDGARLHGFSADVIDALADSGRFARILVEADGARRLPLKAPDAGEPVFPASTDLVVMVAGLSGLGRPLSDEVVFRSQRWSALVGLAPLHPVTPESLARVIVHEEGLARGAPPAARRVLFLNQADRPADRAAADGVLDVLPTLRGRLPTRAVVGRLQPKPLIYAVREFNTKGDGEFAR